MSHRTSLIDELAARNAAMKAIPPLIRDGLKRYVEDGCPVGDFLQAVIANDLIESLNRADYNSTAAIASIASFVYNELPETCWGSRAVYRAWLAWHDGQREGLEGEELQALADAVTAAKVEANVWRRP